MGELVPYVSDPDFTLFVGDVRDVLTTLPDESVNCVVTSPPYWGLRDYGVPGQLGLEPTPEEYVANMVAVFREVKRVLRKDGTCWVNLGDSYAGSWGAQSREKLSESGVASDGLPGNAGPSPKSVAPLSESLSGNQIKAHPKGTHTGSWVNGHPSLKPKDLVGIPWRMAFALQADGWYLRSAITWCKPNCMPESVTDRPTKATEMVFLLTRSPRYYYDAEAVREAYTPDGRLKTTVQGGDGSLQHRDGERWPGSGRNLRDWWEISTQPFAAAHFATYPEALVERCLKAGCPEQVCRTCGKARERIVENRRRYIISEGGSHADGTYRVRYSDEPHAVEFKERGDGFSINKQRWHNEPQTLGFTDCGCGKLLPEGGARPKTGTRLASGHTGRRESPSDSNYAPGVVLDPFIGSGTTALVARRLGRKCIGIELSPEYAALAAKRLSQLSLFAETT